MRWGLLAAALTLLAACTTPAPPPSAPPRVAEGALPLSALPGWAEEDHAAALEALRGTCPAARDDRLLNLCSELSHARIADPRAWLETRLVARPIVGEGLLTGYYAPEYEARSAPDPVFSAPLRARPADLIAVSAQEVRRRTADGETPYPDRTAIESQSLRPGEALAWMRPEELFFLQIQGSGGLRFADGSRRRAVFAAHNGRPFVGIARPMRERGLLADNQTSAANIQAWLAAHRGAEAEALMRENPRYVFFKLEADDGGQPVGAANIRLPAGRAVAVDPAHHGYGTLLWVDADAGALAGAFPRYRRLVGALDTGGAIKGAVRADLYLGRGAAAGVEAGRIRHALRLHRIEPR